MIRIIILAIVTAMVAAMALSVQAQVNVGADQMALNGGSKGPVPFPHRDHQKKLEDCSICHSVFPQEKGSIDKLKAEGQLQKKQIMNKLCIKCHKAEKTAGKAAGPVTCNQCHAKD